MGERKEERRGRRPRRASFHELRLRRRALGSVNLALVAAAEENSISVQSSTRPKAEENFARASEMKNDDAEGRGGLPFTSYGYVHHLVSGQLLGLQVGLVGFRIRVMVLVSVRVRVRARD